MTSPPPQSHKNQVARSLVFASELTWRVAVVVAGVVAVAWLFLELRLVTVPAVVALLVTTVLHPAVDALRRRNWPDLLATWTVLVGALAIVTGLALLLIPSIADQTADLGDQLDGGIAEVERWLRTGPLGIKDVDLQQALDRGMDQFAKSDRLAAGVTLAGEVVAGFLLAMVMTFFFTKDGPKITTWLTARLPTARRETIADASRAAWVALGAYVRGTAVVGLVNGVIIGIGLAIIGVPLAVPLAFITAISAFFPLVGAVVAGAVAALVALFASGPVDALLVLGLVVIVQQVEGDVLSPVVMGRALRLHPLVVLVALTTGAATAGILGAFLAVPVVGVVTAAISSVRSSTDPTEPPELPAEAPA